MDDELLASWAARSPEERQAILKVTDPGIVRLITAEMRQLWAAEIQARQFGVRGPVQPFDQTQLPLLSTMEFGNSGGDGEQGESLVKWPKVFYEDPMVLPSVLRCALPAAGAVRRAPKALRPQRWSQLLQPPAKSWVEFEKHLAQLVEQLVLSAQTAPQRSSSSTSHPEPGARAAPVAAPSAAPGPARADVAPAEAEEADEALGQRVPGAARAAKRARQRERRRMGKAHAHSSVVAEGGAAGELLVGDESAAVEAALAEDDDEDVAGAQAGAGRLPQPWEGVRQVDDNVLNVLRTQVEQLALGPARGGASSSASQVRAAAPKAAAPVKLELDPRRGAQAEGGRPRPAESGQPAAEDRAGLPTLADFGQAARGVGRGRPMGAELQLPWNGPHGRGVGRGRALAPPPGLQGLHFDGGQKGPHGLAQPWMPGPPIPEDEDEMGGSPHLAPSLPSGAWLPDLPVDALGLGGERTPSWWASYPPTPSHTYEQAPVGGLPRPAAGQLGPGVSAALLGAAAAVAGTAAADAELPAYLPGVIPMYVTVPIAMAHACPHCGKHFALPPGQQAEAEPDERDALEPAGVEEPPG